MSAYPTNIGTKLVKSYFSLEDLTFLKSILPKNLIIRVYGLAGVGKGTLSKNLANSLNIPNIESSLILRCATFVYKDLGLEINKHNTDTVFDSIITYIEDNNLCFEYKGRKVDRKDLKNAFIDNNVTTYSNDLYVRDRFDEMLDDLVQRVLDSPCVADGRGSHEPYLVNAENNGFKVIRILLDASDEVKAKRYYENYVKEKKSINPNYQETVKEKVSVLAEFKEAIIARNEKDIKNIEEKKIGLISDDSGILDSSNMTPQEVLETALSFVFTQISPSQQWM